MPTMPTMQGMPSLPRPASAPDFGMPQRSMEATTMLPSRANPVWTRIVVGLAVGLALLAIILVAMPSRGRIAVNVNDQRGAGVNRVDIFVDGKKMTQCDTAPCLVDGLSTGSHEVKVLAEGYDAPAVQAIVVESHHDTPANFIVGSSRGMGIKVSGAQAGVKLFIDDKEIGPLPQDVHDLTPGDHVIHVAGSERYQPFDKHVIVERDRVEDLGTVTLKVLKGKVTVAPGTVGARVYIVSGSDRRELPMLPISVDIDTTKSWALEASKPGYEDYRQLISFDDGQAEKAYTVTLEPKSAATPTFTPPAQAWNPSPAPAPAPRSTPAPAPAPAPAAEGAEAFLNINSIPASTCFLDGRSLGSTPRLHVSVKPGSHTVKFVDSDDGLTKSIFVSVGSGETKTASARLNQ
jgi:serine/threonine-protein kinase